VSNAVRLSHDYNFQLSTFNSEPLNSRVPAWDYIIVVIAAYLLGSIPTGFLVAKAKGVDIRAVGSGNIGATNAMRALGRPAGIFVLLMDAAKGYCAVLAASFIAQWLNAPGADAENLCIIAGIFAVLGHNYSCWIKFKGGKGVATTAGVYLALAPWPLLIALGVFVLAALLTRYVSVGSIAAAVTLPIAVYCTQQNDALNIVTLFLGVMVIYKHKTNIQRLMAGTENRLGKKKETK
jgi:glycerol-3-phosphate acyltransferase PlsY